MKEVTTESVIRVRSDFNRLWTEEAGYVYSNAIQKT